MTLFACRSMDNLHYEKFADGTIKCIEDEIPFEIPESWAWVRLGDVGIWGAGATPSRAHPEFYDGTIPWLKTGDLTDTYITSVPENISQLALEKTSVRINPVGSVLIAMYGATIGKLGILTFPATTNQACCACAPLDGIEELYLFYFLMSQRAIFIKRAEGGAQPNISKEKIISTLIPIPPSIEQKQIIEKIESYELFLLTLNNSKIKLEEAICLCKSKILDLAIRGKLVPQDESDEPASVLLEQIQVEKEELIRQGKIKRNKRESVIYRGMDNSYYERFADGSEKCINEEIPFEIPKGWIWCRGCSCFKSMQNTKPTGDYFDYIDIDAVDNVHHNIKSIKHLSVQNAPSRARRIVPKDSVLFSLVRPYLKNIVLITDRYSHCIASTGFYVCISNGILNPKYMELLMCSEYVVQGLMQFMKGDNSPSINNTHIENWLYPVPPLSLQKRIAEKVLEIEHHIEILDYN